MGIYDVTIEWTPGMEHVLKSTWGVVQISEIEKTLGKTKEAIVKHVKHLKMNGGNDDKWTLEDVNKLTELIEETNLFLPGILRAFPEKKISSIYDQIEKLKTLNNDINYSESIKKKRLYNKKKTYSKKDLRKNQWTQEEDIFLASYLKENKKDINLLVKKMPKRTKRAIQLRLVKVKKELIQGNCNVLKEKPKSKKCYCEASEYYKKMSIQACDIIKATLEKDDKKLEECIGKLEYYVEQLSLNFSNIYTEKYKEHVKNGL